MGFLSVLKKMRQKEKEMRILLLYVWLNAKIKILVIHTFIYGIYFHPPED